MNKINPRLRVFIFNYNEKGVQLMALDTKALQSDHVSWAGRFACCE